MALAEAAGNQMDPRLCPQERGALAFQVRSTLSPALEEHFAVVLHAGLMSALVSFHQASSLDIDACTPPAYLASLPMWHGSRPFDTMFVEDWHRRAMSC